MEGLEPTRREALDPKSSVSTNFTTSAEIVLRVFRILPVLEVKVTSKFTLILNERFPCYKRERKSNYFLYLRKIIHHFKLL